jgi:hypothetical protein
MGNKCSENLTYLAGGLPLARDSGADALILPQDDKSPQIVFTGAEVGSTEASTEMTWA